MCFGLLAREEKEDPWYKVPGKRQERSASFVVPQQGLHNHFHYCSETTLRPPLIHIYIYIGVNPSSDGDGSGNRGGGIGGKDASSKAAGVAYSFPGRSRAASIR